MGKQQAQNRGNQSVAVETMDVKAPFPDIHDVATRIFLKTYMDTAKTPEYLSEKAYEAAEAFCEFARSRYA